MGSRPPQATRHRSGRPVGLGPQVNLARWATWASRICDALGPDHPDALAARSNLVHWTGEAGDAVGARDQLAALVPVEGEVWARKIPQR